MTHCGNESFLEFCEALRALYKNPDDTALAKQFIGTYKDKTKGRLVTQVETLKSLMDPKVTQKKKKSIFSEYKNLNARYAK